MQSDYLQADLELLRWNYYIIANSSEKKLDDYFFGGYYWSVEDFWLDSGAFVAALPRRSGKTTMVGKMCRMLDRMGEGYAVCVRYPLTLTAATNGRVIRVSSDLRGVDATKLHLIADDFFMLDREIKDEILERYWKSMTLVGTITA